LFGFCFSPSYQLSHPSSPPPLSTLPLSTLSKEYTHTVVCKVRFCPKLQLLLTKYTVLTTYYRFSAGIYLTNI
jgi:hypothetical protein